MPYRMEASAGSGQVAGAVRTITAGFNGTDQVTLSAGVTGGAVGDLLQVRGAASGNNQYVIVESISATVKRLQPTPPNLGGPGAATAQGIDRLLAGGGNEAKVASRAVTAYPATNQIQSTGALFVTNGVRPNDQVILGPGGAASVNEGTHVVASVIDENNITVRTNTLGLAAPTGDTVIVVRANNVIVIEDEAAATMAAILAGLTFVQPAWGVAADYVGTLGVLGAGTAAGVGEAYTLDGVLEFRLVSTTGVTVTVLNIVNECWINLRMGSAVGGTIANTVFFNGEVISGSVASPMQVRMGTRVGDGLSGRDGALLFGVSPGIGSGINRFGADEFNVLMRASATKVRRFGANTILALDGASELLTSQHEGTALGWPVNPSGAALVLDSFNTTSEQAFSIIGSGAGMANLTLDSELGAFIVSAPDALITGLLKSDGVPAPAYLLFSSPDVIFLDPRADYPLGDMAGEFFPGFGGGGHRKNYSWNPRFVSRDSTGGTGIPIQNLRVSISEVNETTQVETPISGSPFTTDANGRLNAGAGLQLSRQRFESSAVQTFSHRIEAEGPGFRRLDQVIQVTSPDDGDIAVDYLQPDFEGEFAT